MDSFKKLVDVVGELRGKNGCAWDKQQTLYSLKDDFIEEAYELISALDNDDTANICEELGDVLLHVVLHAQIASESGKFNIDDVTKNITEKLIRRHPHVFSGERTQDTDRILKRWEEIKTQEKIASGEPLAQHYLDKADKGQPPLSKAHKLQKAAAKTGFDWPSPKDIMNKVNEELSELKEACESSGIDHIKEEMGDLLFVLANLSRHYGFTADEALRGTNDKFVKRFNYIEDSLRASGKAFEDSSLEEMESLWQKAKEKGK